MRYLPALQRMFAGYNFRIIDESESLSAYSLTNQAQRANIFFYVHAEQSQLPVALASMVSKYVRELYMILFNRFWAQRLPGLKPTAGYYTDGRRFSDDIDVAVRKLGIDEQILYRCR